MRLFADASSHDLPLCCLSPRPARSEDCFLQTAARRCHTRNERPTPPTVAICNRLSEAQGAATDASPLPNSRKLEITGATPSHTVPSRSLSPSLLVHNQPLASRTPLSVSMNFPDLDTPCFGTDGINHVAILTSFSRSAGFSRLSHTAARVTASPLLTAEEPLTVGTQGICSAGSRLTGVGAVSTVRSFRLKLLFRSRAHVRLPLRIRLGRNYGIK